MGWEEELFAYLDDLESQAVARFDAERAIEIADRGRAEYAEVRLAARLMASLDAEVTLEVQGIGRVSGSLVRVSSGWVLVTAQGQDWVIATSAVEAVSSAAERAIPEVAWPVTARLGIGSALRRLADAGAPCVLLTRSGSSHDGLIRRVGADFVEVEVGERGHLVLVAFASLAAVRSVRST